MPGAATHVRGHIDKRTSVPLPFDPFRQSVETPLRSTFYPLGFPLELATNSPDILLAAEENWSGFPNLFHEPPIELTIAVDESDSAARPDSIHFRARRHLMLLISDLSNFAVCDLSRAFAFCWVSRATARDRDWFRYFYLDTIAYLILWQKHLARIHASCVARGGRGVLLCGPSGAGKSCLAYACAMNGWTFITDEAVSLVRRSSDRMVLGKPHAFRFRETASQILPELDGKPSSANFVGKITLEVPTAGLSGIETGFHCRAEAIVFLNRDAGGEPRLVPLEKQEAWRRLEQDLPLFEQPVHEEHKASLRSLLEAGVYELRAYDLASGVKLLDPLARG